MSDVTPVTPAIPAPATPAVLDVPPTPPAGDPPKADEPLGAPGIEALRKERERADTAEKAMKDANARIKEFEDRDKSEADKQAERLATAEKTAVDATREALRYKIASRHQISDEDAETFLTGTDEDAITKQAERLAALRGEAKPPIPKPDPSQGPRPDGTPDIEQQIADATKAGNHRLAIALKRQKAYGAPTT